MRTKEEILSEISEIDSNNDFWVGAKSALFWALGEYSNITDEPEEQTDETPVSDMYCDTYASLARHGDYLSA